VVPILLALACAAPTQTLGSSSCDLLTPEPGQVRVCRLGAGDFVEGSGAQPGDWRLQNALLDVVVRAEFAPLTRLQGRGGTVVAAMPTGAGDPVVELVPELPDGWFDQLFITALPGEGEAALSLTGIDLLGQEQRVTWRMLADSPELLLEGAAGLSLVVPPGAVRVGSTVEHEGLVVGALSEPVDLGGELRWQEADRLVIAERRSAYEALWPEGIPVSGLAPGASQVEARAGGEGVARLDVDEEGAFAGEVPPQTDELVALAEGYAAGSGQPPGEDLALALGAQGLLWARAVDESGADIPAVLLREGRSYAVPAGGAALPVGPGSAETWLWAGPGREARHVSNLAVEGEATLSAVLRAVGEPGDTVLAELDLQGWPDAQVREPAADILARAHGRGVGYAVLLADDEVAQELSLDPRLTGALVASAGSRAATDSLGSPFAWPWRADETRAAHSAAPWQRLEVGDLLSYMHYGGNRVLVLDSSTVQAVLDSTDPVDLERATAMRLADLDELGLWLDLLAQGQALPVVGPWTWVEDVDPFSYGAVDVEAGLLRGRTIASTGPRIHLRVEGQGPGSLVETELDLVTVQVQLWSPAWAPVDELVLYGSEGELARVTADRTTLAAELEVQVPAEGFVVAVARGSERSELTGELAWAVSSAVWVERE
jgi:hypothetical protein